MSVNSMNIVGRISHFFTVNRPLSLLLLAAILLFGLFSFWLTPKQYNPEIVRPAFAIELHYAGATTDAAVDRVVYELVEKIRTVPGVEDIYTEVSDGATINTTVIFEVGYEATKAKLDLLSQIEQHKYLKSGSVSEPLILEINPETIPVLQVVFASPERSIPELRQSVVTVSESLGSVPGVSEVSVHGGYTESLIVTINPQQLQAAGLTIGEVSEALSTASVRTTSRGITSGAYQIGVMFDGQAASVDEIGLMPVAPGVYLRDVATIYEGASDVRSYVFHQSSDVSGEVVVLAVSKVEGGSAPVVTKAVLLAIEEKLTEPAYTDLTYQVVGDDGATASSEIFGLTKNLLTSIIIVTAVLMLFLSTRAALVVLIAIPVTLLIVFGLGLLFDQTINRITLFALILSLGLLVDSAIVVVENIYSHLKEWRASDSAQAHELVIARAVHEIGVGLLLSTLTSVIVFLPMGYITGMMGPYMGPIAFFVPAALLVSLLVAIIVTPFVAAHLIDVDEKKHALNRWFGDRMQALTSAYSRFLKYVLSSRRVQQRLLRGVLLLFVVSLLLPLFALVHFQMLPKADRDQFYVYIDLPVDVSSEATRVFGAQVVDVLLADTDVVSIESYVSEPPIVDFNGLFKGAQTRGDANQATLRVNLTLADARARSSTEIATAGRLAVGEALPAAAVYVRFMEEPPGPPVRATFVAKVSATDAATQSHAARRLLESLAHIDGIVDHYVSEDAPVSRVVYDFDEAAGNALGVSVQATANTIALLGGAQPAAEYLATDNAEFTPILITLPRAERSTPAAINGLSVRSVSGDIVPLQSLVTTRTELRPSDVSFEGSEPVTYVTAEVEGRSIVYVMIDVMRSLIRGEVKTLTVTDWGLFGMELTDTLTGQTLSITWGGEWEMTLENFRDLGIAMGVALVLVYGVLVAQYNRFSTPAYILVTVPLGLIGILWGFFVLDALFGIYLTATALIGFIALIGIVVNNAIIFLEYVEQLVQTGHSFKDALLGAGQARLRPIVLTSLTTVLGSLTIAGDPVWSGLAWAIVFGLSLSTVLTLVIYPTLLMYFTSEQQ